MQNQPPPLPPEHPLKYQRFEGLTSGCHTAGYDRKRLDDARNQALAWVNANPGIEIVSIDSTFGTMLAVVTVWYRE